MLGQLLFFVLCQQFFEPTDDMTDLLPLFEFEFSPFPSPQTLKLLIRHPFCNFVSSSIQNKEILLLCAREQPTRKTTEEE